MTVQEKIEQDLIAAMKASDTLTRDTLRLIKGSLQNQTIAEGGQPLTDAQVISILQKEVKRRQEAETLYHQANKADLAEQEKQEAAIISRYLPAQLDEDTVRSQIVAYLQANPTTIAQMGEAMGKLAGQFKGQADMGLVAKILREQLSA